MPYDPNKTQTLLQALPRFKGMPNYEFLEALGAQLKESEEHMALLSKESRDARTDLTAVRRELANEEALHRETREELARLKAQIASMKTASAPRKPGKSVKAPLV